MLEVVVNSLLVGVFTLSAFVLQPRVRAIFLARRNPTPEALAAVHARRGRCPAWLVVAQVAGGAPLAALCVSALQNVFQVLPPNPDKLMLDYLAGWPIGMVAIAVILHIERGLPRPSMR